MAIMALLLFANLPLRAQEKPRANVQNAEEYLKNHVACGATSEFFLSLGAARKPTGGSYTPGNFPPSAIVQCGKFAIYYEDLIPANPQIGFNDPALGSTRRNTLCAVLTSLQNTFDFSNVSPSNPVRLYVNQSFAPSGNPAPVGTTWYAQAGPFFNPSPSSPVNGYVHDYVISGTDPAPASGFHASMKVNFDQAYHQGPSNTWIGVPVNYYNNATGSLSSCQMDLYTTLLHEMGHALGFISLIQFTTSNPFTPSLPTGQYSGTDDNIYATFSGTPFKLITSGVLNNYAADNNYWMGNQPAPKCHPVYGGWNMGWTYVSPGSFAAHLDDQIGSYTRRWRISPGNYQDYVMGPFGMKGVMRRDYSEGDLQVFNQTLGYSFTPSFAAAIAPTYTNLAPYSTRMAGYTNYAQDATSTFPDCMPADFPVLVNDLGASLTYYFANDPSISDANGDAVYAKPGTIINYRGCGNSAGSNGGNNHDQVTPITNGSGNIIGFTYTPRPNFFGRAQLGLSLWDGKETGSYVMYTIDVAKGTNVNYPSGSNLVLNGTFEEGTEVKTAGANEGLDNTTVDQDYTREARFNVGQYMADGHPLGWFTNNWIPWGGGTIVKGSQIPCGQATTLTREVGGWSNSCVPGGYNFPYLAPTTNGGNRYQAMIYNNAAFYPLGDSVRSCHYYKLEFDAYATYPLPNYPAGFNVGFLNSFDCSVNWSNFFALPSVSVTPVNSNMNNGLTGSWKHYEMNFWYCGPASAMLYLRNVNGTFEPVMIDNISLKDDVNTSPMTATITPTIITPCQTVQLDAGGQNGCGFTYQWSLNGGPVFSTASSITVNYGTTPDVYTLTVTDACGNVAYATYKTDVNNGITISASGNCIPMTLTGIPNNPSASGTWNWNGPGIFNVNSQSINPPQAGTYTVTFTSNGCTASASYTVTSGAGCCADKILTTPGTIVISNNSYPNQTVVPSMASDLINYFGTNIITTSDYLLFDDNFIVDKDIVFDNCPNMVFAATPSSGFVGMTVMPGVNLGLSKSTLRAACKTMWNGIFADDPSSSIYSSGCDIHDMKDGIHIKNDVGLKITNTQFIDNYYGLYMLNGTSAYNPSIWNNAFATSSGLLSPYSGQIANTGIYLQNMHSISIGDPGASTYSNTFSKLSTGVYVYDTLLKKDKDFYQVRIYNALFNAINGGNYNLPGYYDLYKDAPGNAVFGRNASNTVAVCQVLMYNNSPLSGRVTKTTKGVTLYNMSGDIRNIQMQAPVWGITISKPEMCSYTIWNNNITNVYRGIEIVGTPQSGSIKGNIISSTSGTSMQTFNGVNMGYPFGIASSYYNNSATNTLYIDNNNITMNNYGGQGIYMGNGGPNVRAYQNVVKFTTTSAGGGGLSLNDALYGINATYCLGTTVQGNTVTGNSTTLNNSRANLAGIYLYNSQKMGISCNHDTNTKYGWYVTGNCITGTSQVVNNDFYNHGYGILYRHLGVNGTFGNVGTPLFDANNIFKGIYATYLKKNINYYIKMYRLSICNTASADRFYTSNGTLTQNESYGNIASCFYGVQTNSLGYSKPKACNGGIIKVPSTYDKIVDIAYAEAVAQRTIAFEDFQAMTQWMEEKRLYEQLANDLDARRTSSILANFYNSNHSGIYEQIRATDEQLALLQDSTVTSDTVLFDHTLQQAKAAQSAIAPTNHQENNEVTINEIFLRYMEYGVESIDNSSDRTTITDLANQCPFEGGTAVFKARTLYGIFYPSGNWDDFTTCNIGANRGSSGSFTEENNFLGQDISGSHGNGFEVYPNPTDGKVTVKYHLESGEKGAVEITDLFGRIVIRNELQPNAQGINLDLGSKPAGIYYYRYFVNDQMKQSGKLVLVR